MMERVVEAKVSEQARIIADEKEAEETAAELAQALADEEVADGAEERLRRKAVEGKKKTVATPSAQPTVDPREDIYLAAFYIGATFKILGDPTQLEVWWHMRQ